MNFIRLIADFMRGFLNFPMRVIQGMRAWRQQRLNLQIGMRDVGREAEEARGIKKFLQRLGKVFLFTLLVVILCLVFWGLYYLNDYFDLPRILGGPLPWLRPFWLPILVTLFVGTLWLAIRLWGLLGPERDASAFPDIELAWAEAEAALVQAGVKLRDTPLYFVLGKPNGSIDAVFAASRITWLVRQTPMRVDAPLQVYANKQAIFVAFTDNSLLGKVLTQLASNAPSDVPMPEAPASVFELDMEPAAAAEFKIAPPADPLATPNLLAEERSLRDVLAGIDPGERMLSLEERTEKLIQSRWRPMSEEALALAGRRLHAAVRVVSRARRPYCSANGVLLVVPHDALMNSTDANEVAGAADEDLQIVLKAGQTRCPTWLLIADMHTVPGFDALFAALDNERRQRLVGRDFPLNPDIEPAATPMIANMSIASFLSALSILAERLFTLESSQSAPGAAFITNGKLFELSESLRQRKAGLEILLRRILQCQTEGGIYFGGFYVGATGADPNVNQAFVSGLFRRMLDNQSKVTWTDEALEEETDYQRWATFGYASMAAFCAALIALGYWRWMGVG
jgi:hypothetical protein